MSKKYNDLFKIVSFRSPENELTINLEKPPFHQNTLLKNIHNSQKSTRQEVESLLEQAFSSLITLEQLQAFTIYSDANRFAIELQDGNTNAALQIARSIITSPQLPSGEIQTIITNWVTLKANSIFELNTQESTTDLQQALEIVLKFIGAVHLIKQKEVYDSVSLLDFIFSATITTPSVIWILNKKTRATPNENPLYIDLSHHGIKINDQKKTADNLATIQQLEDKFEQFYLNSRKTAQTLNSTDKKTVIIKRKKGVFTRFNDFLFGSKSIINNSSKITAPLITINDFKTILSKDEEVIFDQHISNKIPPNENNLSHVFNLFTKEIDDLATLSNKQLTEINKFPSIYSSGLFQRKKNSLLPPTIQTLGMMDLFVVREHLDRYEANEISHIENILQGETKTRNFEHSRETEVTTTISTQSETESISDNQTSERYELQSASQNTVQNEFSINGGVNINTEYGVADISTSVNTGFSRTSTNSNSQSVSMAKDVTNRSSTRIKEARQQSTTRRSLVKVLEQNSHNFEGIAGPTSGIYKWVEKIQKVSLHHYGKRMMMEFMIPEPAMYYLGEEKKQDPIENGKLFDLSLSKIGIDNYLSLVEEYSAINIPPLPEQTLYVGYSWASQPSERANTNKQDVVNGYIKVPNGYYPSLARIDVSSYDDRPNFDEEDGYFDVSLGGINLFKSTDTENSLQGDWITLPGGAAPYSAQGMPITIKVVDHFDKVATVNITIKCRAHTSLWHEWKLAVYEKLKEGHENKQRELEFKNSDQESTSSLFDTAQSRSSQMNREVEIEEIKKFCIATMRENNEFNIDGIANEGDDNENDLTVNSAEFEKVSPIIRFFESAFEWKQMYYQLYPYYWGRKDGWEKKNTLKMPDFKHLKFMRSGAAKVIVSIKPGFEEKVLHYLESEGEEIDRINWNSGEADPNSPNYELWSEILTDRRNDIIIGNTTLKVEQDSNQTLINGESWKISRRDIKRELYIEGDLYTIIAINETENSFTLNRNYDLNTNDNAVFAMGNVLVGVPWEERLPTNLVVLSENEDQLN